MRQFVVRLEQALQGWSDQVVNPGALLKERGAECAHMRNSPAEADIHSAKVACLRPTESLKDGQRAAAPKIVPGNVQVLQRWPHLLVDTMTPTWRERTNWDRNRRPHRIYNLREESRRFKPKLHVSPSEHRPHFASRAVHTLQLCMSKWPSVRFFELTSGTNSVRNASPS